MHAKKKKRQDNRAPLIRLWRLQGSVLFLVAMIYLVSRIYLVSCGWKASGASLFVPASHDDVSQHSS